MKKLLLAVLVIAPLSTFAMASDQQVQIDARLMEGDKLVQMVNVITKDGKPTPIEASNQKSYVAQATKEEGKVVLTSAVVTEGIFLVFTPTIKNNGQIGVAFKIKKSEIDAIKTFRQDDMEVQLPQVTSSEFEGNIDVADGKEVSIPFGQSKLGSPVTTKYTLKLVVTKG